MSDPVERLRAACLKRGVAGIKSLGRTFRLYDDDGNKMLSVEELRNGVIDYGLHLSGDEARELFDCLDVDQNGSVRFDEFLFKLRGPMSPCRCKVIDQAFDKMDKTGDGVITVDDLKGVYDVSCHPKYKSGEMTKKQVFIKFLESFQIGSTEVDDKITKEEFLNYYAGVSASIDKDVYFDYMMRQAWKL